MTEPNGIAHRPPTLVDGMFDAAARQPRLGFTFQDVAGKETYYSFAELLSATERCAAGLQSLGLVKGDRVALLIQDPEAFVMSFLGAVRAGIVPVPLPPPPPLGGQDTFRLHTKGLLLITQARALIVSDQLPEPDLAAWNLPSPMTVATAHAIRAAQGPMQPCAITPDDVVFLQFTSGSTGSPRGVVVTHRSIVANIACFMNEALDAQPNSDKGVSWLPLHHDMGLIGFVLGPVYFGVPVVLMPTSRFVKRPATWLETIHRHRATITFAPNFAFALVLRRLVRADAARWDLSCLKALGCGAEPIVPEIVDTFLDLLGNAAGLRRAAFMPAYGLAESTLAVAIRRLAEPVRIEQVDREAFERRGEVVSAGAGRPHLVHIGCGGAFASHQIAIRDADGTDLPPCREGEVWVRGPSVCAGYLGDDAGWRDIFRDGWLNTGDRGYLAEGQLFVSGRSKDLIILNGRNVHPQVLESAIGRLDDVRPQCVVAFAVPGESTEEVVVALETRTRSPRDLVLAVEETVQDLVAARPCEVLLLPVGTLPRTTSGKLRRGQVRAQYLDGSLRRLQKVDCA